MRGRLPSARVRALVLTWALVTTGAMTAAACASFSSEESPSSPDAASTDANEGGSATDSSTDGGSADAGPSFCATTGASHDFCADFDAVKNVDEGWLAVTNGTGQTPAFAEAPQPLPSAPRDMKAALEPSDGGTAANASFLRKAKAYGAASGRPRIRIELDFRVERADVVQAGAFIAVLGDPQLGIALGLQSPGSSTLEVTAFETVIEDAGFVNTPRPLGSTVNMHEWTHLVVVVDQRVDATSPPNAAITINGSTDAFDLQYLHPFGPAFRADIGLTAGTGGGTWTVHYDNVTLDWQ